MCNKILIFNLLHLSITYHFKIQSSTDKCIFRYHQSNVRWLLPVCNFCRACSNQIVEHSSDNKTVLGSSQKLWGSTEHLIAGGKKSICQLSMLLKSAVSFYYLLVVVVACLQYTGQLLKSETKSQNCSTLIVDVLIL